MLKPVQNDLSIADLFQGNLQLASPPTVYSELQAVIDDPTKFLADAAFIIEKDAALAINLLKIVNNAFYGFPAQISSISQAINLIGTKELQNIVLSTIVMERFSNIPSELMSMHDFWARNLRCALISQEIDHHLGKEYNHAVFICGLLHHIGQLVFFLRIPELTRETSLILQAMENPSDIDERKAEESVIGFNHYQAGAALTELWKLPEVITASIKLHAYPGHTGTYQKIAAIVRLADGYSHIDRDWSTIDTSSLNISTYELSEIIDKTHERFEEIFKVFYHG